MSIYTDTIRDRFGGVLSKGCHEPDGKACALEAAAVSLGLGWTDDPELLGLPDVRDINDAPWPTHVARTKGMIEIVEAVWGWGNWPSARQHRFIRLVAKRTIQEILPIALRSIGLIVDAAYCEELGNITAAKTAASAARRVCQAYAGIDDGQFRRAYHVALACQAGEWAANKTVPRTAGIRYAGAAILNAATAAKPATVLKLATRIWVESAALAAP